MIARIEFEVKDKKEFEKIKESSRLDDETWTLVTKEE